MQHVRLHLLDLTRTQIDPEAGSYYFSARSRVTINPTYMPRLDCPSVSAETAQNLAETLAGEQVGPWTSWRLGSASPSRYYWFRSLN